MRYMINHHLSSQFMINDTEQRLQLSDNKLLRFSAVGVLLHVPGITSANQKFLKSTRKLLYMTYWILLS